MLNQKTPYDIRFVADTGQVTVFLHYAEKCISHGVPTAEYKNKDALKAAIRGAIRSLEKQYIKKIEDIKFLHEVIQEVKTEENL